MSSGGTKVTAGPVPKPFPEMVSFWWAAPRGRELGLTDVGIGACTVMATSMMGTMWM